VIGSEPGARQDRGGGAGDAGHAVMFGQPETPVAPALAVPGKIEGVTE